MSPACARASRSAPTVPQRSLWLRVYSDGVAEQYVRCERDTRLAEGLVPTLAHKLGLLPKRVQLLADGVTLLSLSSTPNELGLQDDQFVEARERAAEKWSFKLAQGSAPPCTLQLDLDVPLSRLVAAYCAHAEGGGGKLKPAQVALIDVDGDPIDVSKNARQLDLEDGDQLGVEIRR